MDENGNRENQGVHALAWEMCQTFQSFDIRPLNIETLHGGLVTSHL